MNCPRCQTATLDVLNRAGIEVDVCPRCQGAWLDRGEIERLVSRIASTDAAVVPGDFAPQPSPFGPDGEGRPNDPLDDLPPTRHHDDDDRDDDDDHDDDDHDDDRDDDDDDLDDDDRDADERSRKRKKKKKRKRSLTYLLGEALEEVFDL